MYTARPIFLIHCTHYTEYAKQLIDLAITSEQRFSKNLKICRDSKIFFGNFEDAKFRLPFLRKCIPDSRYQHQWHSIWCPTELPVHGTIMLPLRVSKHWLAYWTIEPNRSRPILCDPRSRLACVKHFINRLIGLGSYFVIVQILWLQVSVQNAMDVTKGDCVQ